MAPPENNFDSSGELGQADIDALVGGGSAEGAPGSVDSAPLTPEDIDAALRAAASAGSSPTPADEGLLSQEDIDAALAAAQPAFDGNLTQADIDAALAGASAGAEPARGPAVDTRVDSAGRPFDAAAAAMAAALEEERWTAAPTPAMTRPVDLPDFTTEEDEDRERASSINLIQDVELRVKIELGRTRMLVEDVLTLGEGSVVELDKLAGDPVDVFVNDRLVARGEVLVLNDNFCVRISEVVSSADARQVG